MTGLSVEVPRTFLVRFAPILKECSLPLLGLKVQIGPAYFALPPELPWVAYRTQKLLALVVTSPGVILLPVVPCRLTQLKAVSSSPGPEKLLPASAFCATLVAVSVFL